MRSWTKWLSTGRPAPGEGGHEGPRLQELDSESARLAGPTAFDCGHVPARFNARAANDFVLNAFSHKRPIRVRYDLQIAASQLSYGLAGTPDGQVLAIHFDGAPSRISWAIAAINADNCPEPTNLRVASTGTLTCFPDRLDSESARLAGGNALNCGRVPARGNAETANGHRLSGVLRSGRNARWSSFGDTIRQRPLGG